MILIHCHNLEEIKKRNKNYDIFVQKRTMKPSQTSLFFGQQDIYYQN